MFDCKRVYKNGDVVEKKLLTQEEVNEWVWSNVKWRFGCALFVDGKCHYNGYLTEGEIKEHEKHMA
jgi:hypothetical protein